jgi:Tfp pilus assembly protein PilW
VLIRVSIYLARRSGHSWEKKAGEGLTNTLSQSEASLTLQSLSGSNKWTETKVVRRRRREMVDDWRYVRKIRKAGGACGNTEKRKWDKEVNRKTLNQ